jgi:hypothetical protein
MIPVFVPFILPAAGGFIPPMDVYVGEDGVTPYITEAADGFYVPEGASFLLYDTEDLATDYVAEDLSTNYVGL